MKRYDKDAEGIVVKTQKYLRTYGHANSARKIADRFEDDAKEAAEFTDSPLLLRKGKRNIPDEWDDVTPSRSYKFPQKGKGTRHRDRETIRKPDLELPEEGEMLYGEEEEE